MLMNRSKLHSGLRLADWNEPKMKNSQKLLMDTSQNKYISSEPPQRVFAYAMIIKDKINVVQLVGVLCLSISRSVAKITLPL